MSKYDEFIQSIRESREDKYFQYSERHHILPRCVGGTDDEENLIYLTYQEHFIAHKLLLDEYPEDRGIISAFHWMCGLKKYECTPEDYAVAKKKFSDSQRGYLNPATREDVKKKIGEASRGRVFSEESRKKISDANIGRKPTESMLSALRTRSIGNTYFSGKTHTDEWKSNCSNWMKGNKNCLGKVWVHKDTERHMIDPEDLEMYISDGYELGIGSIHSDEIKEICRQYALGRVWINDGTVSKMIYEIEGIPEGWVRGRLMKKDERGRFVKNG